MPLDSGQLLGSYRVLGRLGAGAMGEVHRAEDTKLGREVAIKVLPPDFAADEERRRRFEREARTLASLNHPNIAQIFAIEHAAGVHFLVLELVPGETLEDRIARGPLPLDTALDVCAGIAAGLESAHAAGVIHRDLKPANVRITPDGRVKVLDFGLAKPMVAERADGSTIDSVLTTEEGRLLGTPTYMAPEQVRGMPVDRRIDVWAFGCVLFECLTGRRPFGGQVLSDVLAAVLQQEPDWTLLPPGAPGNVRRVLARCLQKDPNLRLRDVGDAMLLLRDTAGEPEAASGTSRVVRLLQVAVAAAIALVIGLALRGPGEAQAPPRVIQLTYTGRDHQPHVSPDGRLIAFTSDRTGISRIWLRQVGGGGEQPLTEGPDWRPRFSPDGTSVAFVRGIGRSQAAFRVPAVGGQPRKVLDDVTEIEWAPDGRRFAFLRGASGEDVALGTAVGVFDPQGESRILYRIDSWDLIGLAWSPDGGRLSATLAGQQGGDGDWRMVFVDVETGEAELRDVSRSQGILSKATWSGPSSMLLAISTSTVSGTAMPARIVRYDVRDGTTRDLLWSPNLFPFRGSLTATTQIGLIDDHALVFDTCAYTQALYLIDLATGDRRRLLSGDGIDRQPVWHPDGDRVMFTSNRSGNIDLFVCELANERLVQVTDDPRNDWDGAFTPDGRSILWGSDRSGLLDVWIAGLDGTGARQITHEMFGAENPTMTRDGRFVLFTSWDPERVGIVRADLESGATKLLAEGACGNPEVSPDGRHVLFVGSDSARLINSVHVAEIDSGRRTSFVAEIAFDQRAPNVTYGRGRWMPDGRSIVFLGIDEQGRTGLFVQDFDPEQDTRSTRRQLVGFDGELVYESFGISPDGARIVFSAIEERRHIHFADRLPKLR